MKIYYFGWGFRFGKFSPCNNGTTRSTNSLNTVKMKSHGTYATASGGPVVFGPFRSLFRSMQLDLQTLMMPDQTCPFQIETDASKYATGVILTQLDANGDRHPISFIRTPRSGLVRFFGYFLAGPGPVRS